MRARFWGTRGSIAAPGPGTIRFGGNTSCVELTTPSGGVLVLDCGTGARPLGDRLAARTAGPVSATILLTHTHWDHIQGFPFFAPLFRPANHFRVYGPEGAHLSLHGVLAGQMEHHYFPVELDQLAARITYEDLSEGVHQIDGVTVRAQKMNHPSPTLGYRIEGGGKALCYLADHEPYYENVWRAGAPAGRLESIRESGDRQHAEFMQGAAVVIHEAQYTPQEYESRRNWGHSTYPYVVELAAAAGVGRLYLTHHDPSHDDEVVAEIERKARELARSLGSSLEVSCAYEGCEIAV
ncbi:MAG TPA: MBL fold metallo-hydrolase [Bryobacteraceae bacterium]|nr:MBL fold metallo-hydrolase [Bryobacteraceae bacterium]